LVVFVFVTPGLVVSSGTPCAKETIFGY